MMNHYATEKMMEERVERARAEGKNQRFARKLQREQRQQRRMRQAEARLHRADHGPASGHNDRLDDDRPRRNRRLFRPRFTFFAPVEDCPQCVLDPQ